MSDDFDLAVRRVIYTGAAESRIPPVQEVAALIHATVDETTAAVRRLADARQLALQPDGEILMAEPFSAVPTAFVVNAGSRSWWASCIWDALGIPAMLKCDAEVVTSCQCCGQRLTVGIKGGATIASGEGVAHVAVPALAWWNDIVFT